MRILVLGATGGIGVEIVRQAMEQRHTVTALVRNPEGLMAFRESIVVIQGDLLKAADIETAVRDQDAVLSAFGPRLPVSKADSNLLQRFAAALTEGMLRTATRRTVVVSTAFLFKDSIIPPTYLVGRIFFPDIVVDAAEMERIVANSRLDWTIVRPPQLTDKPPTGKYRIREGHLPRFGFKISRADVADFMIKTVENGGSIGRIIGVAQ